MTKALFPFSAPPPPPARLDLTPRHSQKRACNPLRTGQCSCQCGGAESHPTPEEWRCDGFGPLSGNAQVELRPNTLNGVEVWGRRGKVVHGDDFVPFVVGYHSIRPVATGAILHEDDAGPLEMSLRLREATASVALRVEAEVVAPFIIVVFGTADRQETGSDCRYALFDSTKFTRSFVGRCFFRACSVIVLGLGPRFATRTPSALRVRFGEAILTIRSMLMTFLCLCLGGFTPYRLAARLRMRISIAFASRCASRAAAAHCSSDFVFRPIKNRLSGGKQ